MDRERLLHIIQKSHDLGQRPTHGSETCTLDTNHKQLKDVTPEDIDPNQLGEFLLEVTVPVTQRCHIPAHRSTGCTEGHGAANLQLRAAVWAVAVSLCSVHPVGERPGLLQSPLSAGTAMACEEGCVRWGGPLGLRGSEGDLSCLIPGTGHGLTNSAHLWSWQFCILPHGGGKNLRSRGGGPCPAVSAVSQPSLCVLDPGVMRALPLHRLRQPPSNPSESPSPFPKPCLLVQLPHLSLPKPPRTLHQPPGLLSTPGASESLPPSLGTEPGLHRLLHTCTLSPGTQLGLRRHKQGPPCSLQAQDIVQDRLGSCPTQCSVIYKVC